jgi:hypothetical protein
MWSFSHRHDLAARRTGVAALFAAASLAALPAVASADAGTPGVNAAQSVYPTPGAPAVLGEQVPVPTQSSTPSTPTKPSGGQTIAPATVTPTSSGGGGHVTSIPFTGLSALLVAGVGLLLVAGGAGIGRLSRRPAGG